LTALYNEIDPKAAAWLRELIRRDLIAPGDVSEASIEDLNPDDLRRYTQVHFFAGIGVWSYALRRAGWPDSRPVWTGSCPCQPFSAAGKGGGFADERHLWPAFYHLIRECGPDDVLGEQVASKDGLAWLDLVQADLEAAAYANGAIDFCSAGVGAPHIRQRLYWFAQRLADAARSDSGAGLRNCRTAEQRRHLTSDCGGAVRLGNDDDEGLEGQRRGHQAESGRFGEVRSIAATGELGWLGDASRTTGQRNPGTFSGTEAGEHGERFRIDGRQSIGSQHASPSLRGLADDDRNGCETRIGIQSLRAEHDPEYGRATRIERPGPVNGFWGAADWLHCRDERWRPVEPGTFPLAHGSSSRVVRLRGYGNAINAEAATVFIESYIETEADRRDLRLTTLSDFTTDKDIFG
jgi:DNA (cytosine-5)-methyltransferase 1